MSENGSRVVIQPRLKAWVVEQIKRRGLNVRKAAKKGDVAHSTISASMQDDYKAGYHACVGLAKAFNEPLENVLRMADLLPDKPELSKQELSLVNILRELDVETRTELINYAQYLRDR